MDGARYSDPAVVEWRNKWMKKTMRGGCKLGCTKDITYKIAAMWEHHQHKGEGVASLFLDRAKCFDRINRDIIRKLLLAMGAPPLCG